MGICIERKRVEERERDGESIGVLINGMKGGRGERRREGREKK